MRVLLAVIVIVVMAWSGWWWLGSSAHQAAWDSWLDERNQSGWVAEANEAKVRGYPSRFDTTFRDLSLADPTSGWAWSAPVFQILSVAYTPNHVIAVWPGEQKISSPFGTSVLRSERLRGSVVVKPGLALALDRSQLEGAALELTADTWRAAVESLAFATRQAATPPHAHDVHFEAKGVLLPLDLRDMIDPQSVLPGVFDKMGFNGVLSFDKDWDRHAIEGTKPRLRGASIQNFDALWGKMSIEAQGQFTVDDRGHPDGAITLRLRDWKKMIALAVQGGLLEPGLARTIEGGLGLLAGFGNGRELEVPLRFGNGLTRLGPIPIGPSPRF